VRVYFHLHLHVLLFAQTGRNFIGKGIAKWLDADRVNKTKAGWSKGTTIRITKNYRETGEFLFQAGFPSGHGCTYITNMTGEACGQAMQV
jgi:hypothetical protein